MKALITGASSGIGEEIAYILDEKGYDLVLVATNKEKLINVKNKIKGHAEIYLCDLRNEDEVRLLYKKYQNQIDVLINNAGFGLFGEFVKTDLDRELEMINVNIKAVHILTKLFLQDMIKKDSGYILNVASSAGFMAGPKLGTYYATKNYVLKLTEAIYEELRHEKSNVHISALCPGPVETNFNKVAHGKFSIKGISPKYAAKVGVNGLFKNKLIIVPSLYMKLTLFFIRFVPTKLLLRINYNVQDAKTK